VIEVCDLIRQRKIGCQPARFLDGSIGNKDTLEPLADTLPEEFTFRSAGAASERQSRFEGQVALAQYSPEPEAARWAQAIRGLAVFVEKDLLLGVGKRLAPDLALFLARLAIRLRSFTKFTNYR